MAPTQSKSRILLFGGGVHVKYCIDIIVKENKFEIAGIVDSVRELGEVVCGYKVVGRQEDIEALVREYRVEGGIITVGDNWVRKAIYDAIVMRIPDFKFVNAIHPSVTIGSDVELGQGIVAQPACVINPGAKVRGFNYLATGAQIEHDCEIGLFASVSAGSVLGGFVKIGDYSAITLGVTLVDRISIGENTVVGAGSLVLKSLPDNVLAFGVPAKVIRARKKGERFLK